MNTADMNENQEPESVIGRINPKRDSAGMSDQQIEEFLNRTKMSSKFADPDHVAELLLGLQRRGFVVWACSKLRPNRVLFVKLSHHDPLGRFPDPEICHMIAYLEIEFARFDTVRDHLETMAQRLTMRAKQLECLSDSVNLQPPLSRHR